MKKQARRREIPYNYTSLTDREIILKYAGEEAWETLESLRSERITGRSAKLLMEIYGDMFILDRNPYIAHDMIARRSKFRSFRKRQERRLQNISTHAGGKPEVNSLLRHTREALEKILARHRAAGLRRKNILNALSAATSPANVSFSAFHKVSHATDATDWRVEYPEAVVYPDSVSELPALLKSAKNAGLKLIVRGGGTGLTGGAIPLQPDTLVINTEKLSAISPIEFVDSGGRNIPLLPLQAGVVTEDAIQHAARLGYVFATDPTSAWASTIGGNIAENAGGKKAVIWGTCIDNLYDFHILNAQAEKLTVRRRSHPYRKILEAETVIFDVYNNKNDRETLLRSIILEDEDIRRKGLGKDITNKALKGLPGLQKEGGDGIITDARFILYPPFSHARTICLEFYGPDMRNASRAIIAIQEYFAPLTSTHLTALEHIDDKYLDVIGYTNRSDRDQTPKALLLIDVESNDPQALDDSCRHINSLVKPFDTEAFTASDPDARSDFWKPRKMLGAIARHTNAFKLNEDIVIPLPALPEFTDFIDMLNVEQDLLNSLDILDKLQAWLNTLDHPEFTLFSESRMEKFQHRIHRHSEQTRFFLDHLNSPCSELPNLPCDTPAQRLYEALRSGSISSGLDSDIRSYFEQQFENLPKLLSSFRDLWQSERRRRIMIATHMHAGDGNSHVNIPVLSSDLNMMMQADAVVDRVMEKTVALGGVVSGEHGIGITKLKYLEDRILDEYAVYKAEHDPADLFNPGKLRKDFPYDRVYTPSFNLLEMEAFALAAADLHGLSEAIANCVRCGKCKPVCNTHFPPANMLYNPRNKILGTGLIIEAVLYDVLTSKQLSFRHFEKLREISAHCTMCHKCYTPCPVNIDFGDVTILIRNLMKSRNMAPAHPATSLTYHFLRRKGRLANTLYRHTLFNGAFRAQRLAHALNKPLRPLTEKFTPHLAAMLKGRYPRTGSPTLRDQLGLNDRQSIYSFTNPDLPIRHTVFYFPGCGSERMFPEISIAAMALLWSNGIRTVIPPEYACCGYPFKASGDTLSADKIRSGNTLLFHKIAYLVDFMNIEAVLVTCGTCFEMLESYGLQNIFKQSQLLDTVAFLHRNNLLSPVTRDVLNFHEPCHSPLKNERFQDIFQTLSGQNALAAPNCCGDGGTMALAHPEISNKLRDRKELNLCSLNPQRNQEVLTACPACVQGLSKINESISVSGKHLTVYLAEKTLGTHWRKNFLASAKNHIEQSLLN